MQIAIDQMSNYKEFGTPQGIRSMCRFYISLIIPLFFAPYWAMIANQANFALAFFISIVVQIAMVAVLNVTLTLEDPWDNNGLDGIFVDEQLYEVEQALVASGMDPSLLLASGIATLTRGEVDAGSGRDTGGIENGNGASAVGGGGGGQRSRVVRVATDTV